MAADMISLERDLAQGHVLSDGYSTAPVTSDSEGTASVSPTDISIPVSGARILGDRFDEDGNLIPTLIVIPPDGGWGWAILFATFCCNMMVDGNILAFGMYMKIIPDKLGDKHGTVSLIGSLLQGFNLFVGPLVSALANKYGFRVVTIFGSVMAFAGFATSYYASSVSALCFTYGVVGGVGSGMVSLPSAIIIGFYFERWRALATCISVCGSSIGASIIPPLVEIFIEQYGWRVAMVIQSGMMLSCTMFALLYRPLIPEPIISYLNRSDDSSSDDTTPLISQNIPHNLTSLPTSQAYSVPMTTKKLPPHHDPSEMAESFGRSTDMSKINPHRLTSFLGPGNSAYPTVAQVYSASTIQSYPQGPKRVSFTPSILLVTALPPNANRMPEPVTAVTNEGVERRRQQTSRSRDSSASWLGVRPMYRDDILYNSDLTRVAKYKSRASSAGYDMSVTRSPTRKDIEEDSSSRCILCPEAVRRTLATMLDLSLLKSPPFLLLTLSVGIRSAAIYIPSIFLPDRARFNGVDRTIVSILITIISVSSMISRIIIGIIISSCDNINTMIIHNVSLTIAAVATIITGFLTSANYLIAYCSILGLAFGCFNSLLSILLVDLLGLERLTNAFGLISLFQGLAMMFGPPLAGWFKELTGSYDAVFWFAGILMLISAVILYPLNMVSFRETNAANTQMKYRTSTIKETTLQR